MSLKRQLGLSTAILVVVASMIGTGIFITTGTVLKMTQNATTVLIMWGIGGLVALTGALCYSELATMWPDVGGEYIYLRNTFGLLPSFLTGWISLIVGFSAPVAISAIAFVKYINEFWMNIGSGSGELFAGPFTQKIFAAVIIYIFASLHIVGVKTGSRVQNALTLIKLFIVSSLIGLGVYMADWGATDRLVADYGVAGGEILGLPIMGLALLIIMFSFSGWNGAAYIAGEIKNPERNLPRALFWGTVITTVIYIFLNVIFLISSPAQDIMGKEAVGAIAAKNLFGVKVSHLFTLGISMILLSSISVQIMIGPRVYYAMSKDRMIFKHLAYVSSNFKTPYVSIYIQMILSIIYVFIGTAKTLLVYMGFALGVFPLLTIIGLIYLRVKRPDIKRPYKVPLFPLVPLIYIVLYSFMMVAGFLAWTSTSWFAIGVVLAGIPVFYVWKWYVKKYPVVSPDADTSD